MCSMIKSLAFFCNLIYIIFKNICTIWNKTYILAFIRIPLAEIQHHAKRAFDT